MINGKLWRSDFFKRKVFPSEGDNIWQLAGGKRAHHQFLCCQHQKRKLHSEKFAAVCRRDGIEQRRTQSCRLQMQSFFFFFLVSLLQIQSGRISSCKCKKCDFYLLTATHQQLLERNPNSGFKISRQSTCYYFSFCYFCLYF